MHQSPPSAFDYDSEIVRAPGDLSPLKGWPLPLLFELDQHRPGLLVRLMAARPRRRQAVYAALATGAMDRPQSFAELLGPSLSWHGAIWPAMLAEALVTAAPDKIIATAFGSAPAGLLNVMGRIGPDPMERAAYERLWAVYHDPRQRRRQLVLSSLSTVTADKVAIVETLPEYLLRSQIATVCRTPRDAEDVRALANLALAHCDRSPAEVWASMAQVGQLTRYGQLAERLLRSFTTTVRQPDVAGWEGARLLDTGAKLRQAARDFHNCLGEPRNLYAVVSGEVAFVALDEPRVLVQLQAGGEGWMVTGLYGPMNEPVAAEDRRLACALAGRAGFPAHEAVLRPDDLERVAQRLNAGWHGFEIGDDFNL